MNKLMQIVAKHGTGTDILEMAKLLKANNVTVEHQPLIRNIQHHEINLYDALGFTPNEPFRKMHNIVENCDNQVSQVVEKVLEDQLLTEQMAVLAVLLTQTLPAPIVAMSLGGKQP